MPPFAHDPAWNPKWETRPETSVLRPLVLVPPRAVIPPINRFARYACALTALLFSFVSARAATVSWIGGTGDWNTAANWSTGSLPGPNDDVVISTNAAQVPTITHSSGTHTVKSIQCFENFVLSGGSLRVSNNFGVHRNLTISGGTLIGATIVQRAGGDPIAVTAAATFDGVTMDGILDVGNRINAGPQLTVTNGLVLEGTMRLGNPTNQWYGMVHFHGSQTLSGSGTVIFGNHWGYNSLRVALPNTTLTLGENLTVRGHTGVIGYNSNWSAPANVSVINLSTISADVNGGTITVAGQSFDNQGTAEMKNGGSLALANLVDVVGISVAGGGALSLSGSWTNGGTLSSTGAVFNFSGNWANTGTIAMNNSTQNLNGSWANLGTLRVTNSTVNLNGTFTRAGLGNFERNGGSVRLLGTLDNTGTNLPLGTLGTWIINDGTIRGGVVGTSGGQRLIAGTGGRLDGVTLDGDLDVGDSVNAVSLTVTNGLVLNGTLRVGNPTNQWYGMLHFDGNQTLSGNGTVIFGNHWGYNGLRLRLAETTLTVGSNIVVRGHTGAIGFNNNWGGPANVNVVNQGTISADVSGGIITVSGQSFINQGITEMKNGGSLSLVNLTEVVGVSVAGTGALSLSGSWTNAGSLSSTGAVFNFNGNWANNGAVVVNNSTLNLSGNWTNGGVLRVTNTIVNLDGNFSRAGLGSIERSGGAVRLAGTIDNTGTTIVLDAAAGTWVMNGGTIRGGTVITTNGQRLVVGAESRLDGVTINGELDVGDSVNAVQLTVTNGLVLNGTIRIGNATNQWYGMLNFGGSQTLGGNGTVIFGNHWGYNALRLRLAATTLRIGPGIVVRGHTGAIGYNHNWGAPSAVLVSNQGTISADVSGGLITVAGEDFVNEGIVEMKNGGSLSLVNLKDVVGVSIAGTGSFSLSGSWTNAGTLSSTGAVFNFNGNWANTGSVVVNNSTLNLSGSWTNGGTVGVTNTTVSLNGTFTRSDLGVFERSGGSLSLLGTLVNTGTTTVLDASLGTWVMNGGTIRGGTITTTGANRLVVGSGGRLDGVTVNGELDVGDTVNGAQVTVTNGLVLNGTMRVGNPTNLSYGLVNFEGSQTLSGNGTVIFGNHWGYNSLRLSLANTTLTLGPGIVVGGHTGVIGYNTAWGAPANVGIINQGTIGADVTGGILTVSGNWTNTGVLRATGGGSTLNLNGTWVNENIVLANGSTVSLNGAWVNNGTLRATNGTVKLQGTFTRADLGVFERSGGVVSIVGTLNNALNNLVLDGPWTLNEGTIRGGTVTTSGHRLICSANGGRLDGVILDGDMDVGDTTTSGLVTITNGLVLNGTMRVGNPTNLWYGVVSFDGSQTLSGNGTVIFGNHWGYNSLRLNVPNTTLTLGPNLVVRGNTGVIGYNSAWGGPTNVNVINEGTISADTGGFVRVAGQSFRNAGLAESRNNGTLDLPVNAMFNSGLLNAATNSALLLGGTWTNGGAINMTNAAVFLGGSFVVANLGTINRRGGVVYLTGTLNNVGTGLALDSGTGSWLMQGGTIRGGTVSSTEGAKLICTTSGGRLDGVTYNGDLDAGDSIDGANLTLTNGLVLNGTMLVGNPTNLWYGVVNFGGDQTLGGNCMVIFGNHWGYNSLRLTVPNTSLTIGAGATVRGRTGFIGYNSAWGAPANVNVLNRGTITGDSSGGTLSLVGQFITNEGTIGQMAGGRVRFQGAVLNAGQINPGIAPGNIEVTGSFEQSAAGILSIAVGGLTPSANFSHLNVSGVAGIGGTMAVTLVNGFSPTVSNQFAVVTCNSRSGVLGNLTGDEERFIPLYRTNGVTLLALEAAPPTIVTQPQHMTVTLGRTATFNVTATGTFPLGYQWRFGGTAIPGAIGPSLVVSNVQQASAGNYSVVVSNAYGTVTSASAALVVRQCQAPASLISWWSGDANAYDFAGGNDGSLSNGTAFASGRVGQAFSFDGVDDYVRTPVNGMAFGTNDFSVEGWIKTTATKTYNTIASFDNYNPAIYIRGDGSLQLHPNPPSTMNGFNDGQWHHFAVTRKNGQVNLYKDGMSASPVIVDTRSINPSIFYIGWDNSSGDQFPGLIDEIAVYNHALSVSEIQAIYNDGIGEKCASPSAPIILVNGVAVSGSVTRTNFATIELQTSFTNGVIFYTLDGSSPQNGQLYSTPFSIDQTAVIRAVAYTPDFVTASERSPLTINIVYSPEIVAHPVGQVVAAGSTAQFQVTAAGNAPFTYQWRKGGTPIPGATAAILTLGNVQPVDAGNYSVVVGNLYGSVTSTVATLTVIQPPMVATQPASASVALNAPVMFCVGASGDPLLRYQWRKNGVNIPGATNQCFSIQNVQVADGGNYSVVIENDIGAVASAPALLTVLIPQVPGGDAFTNRITISQNCFSGTNIGATAEIGEPRHAGKAGGRSIWYRWFAPSNGIATFETTGSSFDTLLAVYTGSNISSLTPIAADEDNAGFLNSRVRFNAVTGTEYLIVVDGYAGAQGTYAICWTLEPTPAPLPVITTQPVSRTVVLSNAASFSVVATSAAQGLRFQWFFNGAPLFGQTNSVFNLPAVLPHHVGFYKVAVSNSFVGLFSDTATLEIGPVAGIQSVDKLPDVAATPPGFASGFSPITAAVGGSVGISVSAGSINSQIINNTGSATSPTEPLPCRVLGGASRWLVLQPTATATLRIDTIGSTVDTILSVFIGSNPFTIVPLPDGCDDNGAGDGARSLLRFTAHAGTNYYVQADGKAGTNGIIFINWALGFAPTNTQLQTHFLARQGDSLLLATSAMGLPEPSFQWRRNNMPILHATNRTLPLVNIQPSDAGAYSVRASNVIGTSVYPVALLTVQSNIFAAASDSFDSSHLPWTVSSNATIVYETLGGNPGGYLSMRGAPVPSQLVAPPEYLGEKFYLYGGLLSFDLRRAAFVEASVVLQGGGRMIVYPLPGTPQNNWNSYNLLLHESAGWRRDTLAGPSPTHGEFMAVITSLDEMAINAAELPIDVDNLEFLAPTVPVLSLGYDEEAWLVKWPAALGAFGVEGSSAPGAAGWAPVSGQQTTSGGLHSLRVMPSAGAQFFRLRKLTP